jgi:hypothetical protein
MSKKITEKKVNVNGNGVAAHFNEATAVLRELMNDQRLNPVERADAANKLLYWCTQSEKL